MAVHSVTTSSNLATVNSGMSSGDTMYFAPGTYSIGAALNLVNGCNYIGVPGTILSTTGSVDIFDMVTGTNNGIYISGFTFDETNFQSSNAAIYIVGNTGAPTTGANNITITNCTFQNIGGTTPCVFVYQSDNIRIDNNIANNCYQFVSLHNNDSGHAHQNFSVSHNTLNGVARMGIEAQTTNYPINNLNVNFNKLINFITLSAGYGLGISLVETSLTATSVTVIGNEFFCCFAGLETANSNMTVYGNTFTNCPICILAAHSPGSVFFGNVMRDCTLTGIYVQDGGYATGQYIGTNAINGTPILGNTSGTYGNLTTASTGFDGSSFSLPDYVSVQTFSQLDAIFSGNAPGLSPYLRELMMATADPAYLFSYIYP